MTDAFLPITAMHRLLRKAGNDRISISACNELARILEEVALEIAKEAIEWSKYAKRKTLKDIDIEAAKKRFYELHPSRRPSLSEKLNKAK